MDEKEVEAEIQAIQDLITGTGGTIEEVERWGRKRLAYDIQKVHEGTYTLIRFKGQAQTLKDLDRRYRLNEKLLRHLTVLSEGPPAPPPHYDAERERDRDRHASSREEDFELPRGGSSYRDSGYARSAAPAEHSDETTGEE
jgi:small subunit ribosomal protein S6